MTEEIKVLLVITSSDLGGAQQHVLSLVRGGQAASGVGQDKGRGPGEDTVRRDDSGDSTSARFRFRFAVMCSPGGWLVDELRGAGVPTIECPWLRKKISPWGDLRALLAIVREIKRGGYHLVHAHSSKAGVLARAAAWICGIPSVFTAHGFVFNNAAMSPWKRAAYAAVERLAARFCTRVITVSEADREAALRYGVARPEQVEVVYNGVPNPDEVPQVAYQSDGPREQYQYEDPRVPYQDEGPVVTTVTRLVPDKDLETFLRAARLVLRQYPTVRFLVVGDGPLRHELENAAQVMGIAGRVLFTGVRRDIPEILARSDFFAMSSVKEGLPMALLEAMAAGKPVVATEVGGIPEVIREAETGFLVPPGRPELLAAAIIRVISNRESARRMGGRAREMVRSRFTLRIMIQKTLSVYERALGRR